MTLQFHLPPLAKGQEKNHFVECNFWSHILYFLIWWNTRILFHPIDSDWFFFVPNVKDTISYLLSKNAVTTPCKKIMYFSISTFAIRTQQKDDIFDLIQSSDYFFRVKKSPPWFEVIKNGYDGKNNDHS